MIKGNAINSLLHQEFGKLREIARRLAAQTNFYPAFLALLIIVAIISFAASFCSLNR